MWQIHEFIGFAQNTIVYRKAMKTISKQVLLFLLTVFCTILGNTLLQ